MTLTNRNSQPQDIDVICGRGALSNNHPGNRLFRRLVQANKEVYNEASAQQREMLVRSIAAAVHNVGGRFVRKDKTSKSSCQWREIHSDEAATKILQALRDTQPIHFSTAQNDSNQKPDSCHSSSMLVVAPSWKDGLSISSTTVSTTTEEEEKENDSSSHPCQSSLGTSFQVAQAFFDVADEVLSLSTTTTTHSTTDKEEDIWAPIQLGDIMSSLSPPTSP